MHTQPFTALTPDAVLDALDSIGLRSDGRLLALNSYENRVYQAGMEDGSPLVAKFYRPERWTDAAILEEHAFVATLVEREIPVVPALVIDGRTLHTFNPDKSLESNCPFPLPGGRLGWGLTRRESNVSTPSLALPLQGGGDIAAGGLSGASGFRFSVFARHGGRAPELDDCDTLEWMGRFIGRIHAVGALEAYRHRPTLDIHSFGMEPSEYLLAHDFIPAELFEVYRGVVAQALNGVRRCFERAGTVRSLRLHGDCHVGNVLWTDLGPHFVDFDDSRMGPAIQDLWMLLSGERAEQTQQLGDLLAGYGDFYDFDPRELHLVEALRTLRLIHYAAWIARRWDDPAFPAAFPWFNTQRYWQDRILELREQIALMDEPPLWVV
ncbi:MAG: serine/threonine protein kinase [Gallionella sp.]|nr:serine/threonine protein kinase [Gallionella sp.]